MNSKSFVEQAVELLERLESYIKVYSTAPDSKDVACECICMAALLRSEIPKGENDVHT